MSDNDKPEPFNGIRVYRQRDKVVVLLGNGVMELTGHLDAVGARRIGRAILDQAAELAREQAEAKQKEIDDGGR